MRGEGGKEKNRKASRKNLNKLIRSAGKSSLIRKMSKRQIQGPEFAEKRKGPKTPVQNNAIQASSHGIAEEEKTSAVGRGHKIKLRSKPMNQKNKGVHSEGCVYQKEFLLLRKTGTKGRVE